MSDAILVLNAGSSSIKFALYRADLVYAHSIGSDKMDYMPLAFSAASLDQMCQVRMAFDPERRSNPGKVFPIHTCREWRSGGVV